jgi:hypothetical protein
VKKDYEYITMLITEEGYQKLTKAPETIEKVIISL